MISSSRRFRRERRLLAAAFLALGLCAPHSAALALDPSVSNIQFQTPKLEIPIPNVQFTKGLSSDSVVTLPWIAQYVSGVYTFLLSIVGLVAAVMMIIGGFQYLTSAGDKGKIAKGRKRITDALIGMTLAFGSYLLLYTINPNLTSFASLQLLSITTVSAFDQSFGSTTADTALDDKSPPPPSSGAISGPVGSHTPYVTACPFSLPLGPDNEPADGYAGRTAFYNQIKTSGAVTATSVRDKILQIADLAEVCNTKIGSCGTTIGTIVAMAGVGNVDKCLNNGSDGCNGTSRRDKVGITQAQRIQLYTLRCEQEDKPYSTWPRCSFPGVWPDFHQACIRADCVHTDDEARIYMLHYLKQQLGDDYPDKWAAQLQPGDYVDVYNGNADLVGAHAFLFVGWKSEGVAQVIQGGNNWPGCTGRKCNRTRTGVICLKNNCTDKYQVPMLYIHSPD